MSFITPPPPNPTPTEPSTFRTRAINLFDWITGNLVSELEAAFTWVQGIGASLTLNSVNDTSTTSNTIGTGSKSFTVSASKSYVAGMWLSIADTAAPATNSMVAQVTSYSGMALVVSVPANGVRGSGTKTAWTISLTAAPSTDVAATFLPVSSAASLAASRAAFEVDNGTKSIDYTLSANALTLKLNPSTINFRSATLTSGAVTSVSNASQITTTISSGSTGGTTSGVSSDIVLLAINNAGTMELAWTNLAGGLLLDGTNLITTVAEGGAGAADSINVIYSTTARTSVAYCVVGIFRSTQTTAGTWAQSPSLVHGIGYGLLTALIRRSALDALNPAFSAVRTGSNQSATNAVFTKVQCQTEDYDYTSNYDNATNYRFTPNVAGVYRVVVAAGTFASTALTRAIVTIYKNGSEHKRGADTSTAGGVQGSADVYLNGTTDYIEMYVYIVATTPVIDMASTYFQASLVRAG